MEGLLLGSGLQEQAGDEQAELNWMLRYFSKYIWEPARRKKEEEEKRKRDEEQAKEKEKKEQKARYEELKRHWRETRSWQNEIIRQRAQKLERKKAKNAKQEKIWAKALRENVAAVERAAAMAAYIREPARRKKEEEETRKRDEEQAKEKVKKRRHDNEELKSHWRETRSW